MEKNSILDDIGAILDANMVTKFHIGYVDMYHILRVFHIGTCSILVSNMDQFRPQCTPSHRRIATLTSLSVADNNYLDGIRT